MSVFMRQPENQNQLLYKLGFSSHALTSPNTILIIGFLIPTSSLPPSSHLTFSHLLYPLTMPSLNHKSHTTTYSFTIFIFVINLNNVTTFILFSTSSINANVTKTLRLFVGTQWPNKIRTRYMKGCL